MSATPPGLRLAELLVARLSHDLAGPLGTATGLVELAEETSDPEALASAREAAMRLGQRLRLLRAAWAADPAPLSPCVLEALAEGLPTRARIHLDLADLSREAEFPPEAGRLVLNLLLLGAEALPGGGSVKISGSADREVLVSIAGSRAAWPAGFARLLSDPASARCDITSARSLQAPLTALLAAQAGLRLSLLMPMTANLDTPPPVLLQIG